MGNVDSMQIRKPLHTALLVSDLDRAEWFYGHILGLTKVDRPLRFPGTWYQIGAFQIHLILADNPAVPLPNPSKLGRNSHLALEVNDIALAQDRLSNHGIDYQVSASGRPALFTRDPDGNVLELTQVTG